MTKIEELIDNQTLKEAIENKLIAVTDHPTLPLQILNYTPEAQWSKTWNEATTLCRGLIIDLDGNVIARPFPKFFNYGEQDVVIPEGDPRVYEKLDGSLGIIYRTPDGYAVATRGSFASEQALWATAWLHENAPDFDQPEGVTTLCEIIYAANRIVVDYKGFEGLVCLGAVEIATGQDVPPIWPHTHATDFGSYEVQEATYRHVDAAWGGGEGAVLVWPKAGGPSFRLKLKHPRYVALHHIVTGLSTRTVWESLKDGTFDDMRCEVPDEFYPWLDEVATDLREAFNEITRSAAASLAHITALLPDADRKTLAEEIKKVQYPGLCFALLDGKSIADKTWGMVKPSRSTALILDGDA